MLQDCPKRTDKLLALFSSADRDPQELGDSALWKVPDQNLLLPKSLLHFLGIA